MARMGPPISLPNAAEQGSENGQMPDVPASLPDAPELPDVLEGLLPRIPGDTLGRLPTVPDEADNPFDIFGV